jgi:hypothetical protein
VKDRDLASGALTRLWSTDALTAEFALTERERKAQGARHPDHPRHRRAAGAARGGLCPAQEDRSIQGEVSDDVGPSLAQDRRRRAKTAAPRGQGDRGDRRASS